MTTTKSIPTQPGIAVSTAIVAGIDGLTQNHGEGIVVSTPISAGVIGVVLNHAEGIVLA